MMVCKQFLTIKLNAFVAPFLVFLYLVLHTSLLAHVEAKVDRQNFMKEVVEMLEDRMGSLGSKDGPLKDVRNGFSMNMKCFKEHAHYFLHEDSKPSKECCQTAPLKYLKFCQNQQQNEASRGSKSDLMIEDATSPTTLKPKEELAISIKSAPEPQKSKSELPTITSTASTNKPEDKNAQPNQQQQQQSLDAPQINNDSQKHEEHHRSTAKPGQKLQQNHPKMATTSTSKKPVVAITTKAGGNGVAKATMATTASSTNKPANAAAFAQPAPARLRSAQQLPVAFQAAGVLG